MTVRSFIGRVPSGSRSARRADVAGAAARVGRSHPGHAAVNGDHPGATELTHRVIQAAHDLDPIGLQTGLDLAAASLGLAGCVDDIVLPMARQLRRIARTSRHDTVRELIVTEAIRAWLNHRGSFAPTPRHIGTILLACGPRDPDPVGPESLALLLRFHGRPSRVLAARTPTFTLTIAAQAADTTAVVVFCSEPRARRQTIGRLRAVQALGYPAYFTGTAFGSQRSRRHVPGQYLGTRIQDACTQLIHEHTSEHRG